MTILFFGDVVGKAGRSAIAKFLPELKTKYSPDLTIANGENVAHGKGVTLHTVGTLFEAGVDFLTSGNHIFSKPEVTEVFAKYSEKIIRPANFPAHLPGEGFRIITVKDEPILIINLNGRVFMEKQFDEGTIDNPFTTLDDILRANGDKAKIRLLDFHAEATSEKRGMGFHADGRMSAVLGTHTHIQTADAQILPNGTGYLTDLGMVGAADSIIGVGVEGALKRLRLEGEGTEKAPIEVAETDRFEIGFSVLQIDEATGKCQNIINQLIRA